ncbi:hypothetical protein RhiirA4_478529 [Rhizophagus irregularis]|uniref:Uncharacterized protein n=1 Tax=Rhizophagus irregularis TaxID=588596 RepID=A0A2I1HF08_9GLOM|nr:hypothetical protein RhiirA4_478529 [Rhizophagus irregularis]
MKKVNGKKIKCKRNKSGGSKDEVREYNDISRGKSYPNKARIESMQASMGKLRRIGIVKSDEGQNEYHANLYSHVERDLTEKLLHNMSEGHECCNMVIEIIVSESNRHQLAESINKEPCEVSNLTECIKVKADYGEDLYDV